MSYWYPLLWGREWSWISKKISHRVEDRRNKVSVKVAVSSRAGGEEVDCISSHTLYRAPAFYKFILAKTKTSPEWKQKFWSRRNINPWKFKRWPRCQLSARSEKTFPPTSLFDNWSSERIWESHEGSSRKAKFIVVGRFKNLRINRQV